jgi:hypothetical protein
MARWIARAVCCASGMVTTCRLAGNRESPVAAFQIEVLDVGAGGLGDRSPFSASSEIGACSVGGPSPATSSAPRSCGRARRRETRSPPAGDGRARRVSARGVPLRPCTYRTLRWCAVGG